MSYPIEPYKVKLQIREFVYIGIILLFFSISCIFVYNLNVNLKYSIGTREKELKGLESANAEIRNELLQKTDVRNLGGFIKEYSLIPDKNPDYVEHKVLANR